MNKLIVFFLFMLVGSGLLVGVVQGGSGVVNTRLSANITATDTTLPVLTTTDFLDEDYVIIGSEKIYYTGTTANSFTGCTRGYEGTTAFGHVEDAYVYSEKAAALNYALGFDIIAVQDNLGWAAIIATPFMFFVRTVPQVLRLGTQLLTGDLAVIAIFVYCMAAGFVITLALAIIGSRRVA